MVVDQEHKTEAHFLHHGNPALLVAALAMSHCQQACRHLLNICCEMGRLCFVPSTDYSPFVFFLWPCVPLPATCTSHSNSLHDSTGISLASLVTEEVQVLNQIIILGFRNRRSKIREVQRQRDRRLCLHTPYFMRRQVGIG
jgi:hypothetical protein